MFGKNVQFWQKTIWGWNVVPSWGEVMLIPAQKCHVARTNHTAQTLQFLHVVLQDSYRLPGFYYKTGIHPNVGCDTQTPTGTWPWQCLCFDPMAAVPPATWRKPPPQEKGQLGGICRSLEWLVQPCPSSPFSPMLSKPDLDNPICLLSSVIGKLLLSCVKKEYQRGCIFIKYLQLQ